jgi:hypothetical protein
MPFNLIFLHFRPANRLTKTDVPFSHKKSLEANYLHLIYNRFIFKKLLVNAERTISQVRLITEG